MASGNVTKCQFLTIKVQDGLLARAKGGVSEDRIQNDPAFQRTRENGEEFGRDYFRKLKSCEV